MKKEVLDYIKTRIEQSRVIKRGLFSQARHKAMADGALAELMAIKQFIENMEVK